MHSDTKTAWCLLLTVGSVAWVPALIYGGLRLHDMWMESRAPEGMQYTAGNGPTGAKYEPKGKGTEKLR